MEKESEKILTCVLKKIKIEADAIAYDADKDIKEKLEKHYIESPESTGYSVYPFLTGKKIYLYESNLTGCNVHFDTDLEGVLEKLKELKTILRYTYFNRNTEDFFEIILPDYFDGLFLENGEIVIFKDGGNKAKNIKVYEENGRGFMKIDEQKIPIGGINTAKFNLLKILCDPQLGVARSIESVFGVLEPYTRKKTSDAKDSYLKKHYELQKIKISIKELQRIFTKYNVSRYFKFRIDGKTIRLEYRSGNMT